jgi:hypothetical protein
MNGDPVPLLKRLLGEPVVFIRIPRGKKWTKRRWGHLRKLDMTAKYLSTLRRGNIGVALGERSGGLCCIDWDDDRYVPMFIQANPTLRFTLQTRGARGRVFWLRFKGTYPDRTHNLVGPDGNPAGEFRSNGSQSIIRGTHPDTKQPYRFLTEEQVMVVRFDSIVWPAGVSLKVDGDQFRGTEEDSCGNPLLPVSADVLLQVRTLEDALRRSRPDGPRQNHRCLFVFARALLTLEAVQNRKFSPEDRRTAFEKWHAQASPWLRPGISKDDYLVEFLNACRCAKFPLGGKAITEAWRLANSGCLPPEADRWQEPELKRLIGLCHYLQAINGEKPFYLSSETCRILFHHKSRSTSAKRLNALVEDGILAKVTPGNQKRATRYRYIKQGNASERPVDIHPALKAA